MEHYLRSALIVAGLLILQTTFIPFLSVGGFLPDLFVLWLVYVAVRRGQLEATIAGFIIGLLQDVVTTQFFGLAAFSKTVCGFVAGYFFNENNTEQTLGTYRYMLITGLASVVHNLIYFSIFLQGSQETMSVLVLEATLATSLYTGALSALPMFTFARKHGFAS